MSNTNTIPSSDTLADRLAYVEALVDMNALVLEAMWPSTRTSNDIVPLRPFIHQVLKRSRTTYSTLQTAFFYLFRARPAILRQLHGQDHPHLAYIQCGRRMFLASVMVAAKFVQDKTYRNSAWAHMAGLSVQEINVAERVFLELLGYRLYVAQATFEQWHTLLHTHVQAKSTSLPQDDCSSQPKVAPKAPASPPTPALSPSSTASTSACSSPNSPSLPPNKNMDALPKSTSPKSPPPPKSNKRSLAHLLNSPQPLSRKRLCLSSIY